MDNLISMNYLNKHLHDKSLVIVDCRFNLAQPNEGREAYKQDHIKGAHYLHLDEDLSSDVLEHGGRHPLPNIDTFVNKLEQIGIDKTKHVIAYDDQGGPFASRLWWLLNYLGHDKVSVLNENYSTWKEAGYPITEKVPVKVNTTFHPQIQSDMIVDIDQVKEQKNQNALTLIDARAEERYLGEKEPIDFKAGHIPGAINYFWKNTLTDKGLMKSNEALETYFASLQNKDNLVVYCGSGVTASVTVLALDNLGIKAKLYPGGWSDWSSYDENPVAK